MTARRGLVGVAAILFAVAAGGAEAQVQPGPLNTLYMELDCGRVVIAMRPDLAPKTVEQIRSLTRDAFFDGLMFFAVEPGKVVKTGDPYNQGIGFSDYDNLTTEPSAEPFLRGAVGMLREPDIGGHENSQFFILLADDPSLDGRYTYWGTVVEGMACVDQIERTPYVAWWIKTVRLAADVT